MFVTACATACATDREVEVSQAASSNPLHWMVGTWDCGIVNYHDVTEAQTINHQMSGVYTVVEDDTGIHGSYREKDDHQFGPFDFDDEWTISSERWAKDKAWFISEYKAHGVTVPFEIESAGVVREPLVGSSLLGFSMFGSVSTPELPGVLTLPDGLNGTVTRGWGGVHSSSASTTGPNAGKVTFGRNWRVEIQPATQKQYIDDQCIRR